MMRYIRRSFQFLLIIGVCLLVVMFFVQRRFVIKGFSNLYILFGIIISAAGALAVNTLERFSERKILVVVYSVIIVVSGLFICFVANGISRNLCENEKFYSLSVTGYSEVKRIVLYEYNALMENRGCLCIKVNDHIYKKIPDTLYRVDSGYSLSKPDSLILKYNSESKTLNMKYKMNEKSEYIEKVVFIDD